MNTVVDNDFIEFDKETKMATITLAQLDRTIKLEEAGGKLKPTAPIEHVNLIKLLMEIAFKESGMQVRQDPLTIKEANVRRIRHNEKEDGPCPIEKYVIERLVTKIKFKEELFEEYDDAKGRMAIGLSYSEKGIQVVFGFNVAVCQNMNIWGEHFFSTYGKDRISFSKGIELFTAWMKDYNTTKELAMQRVEYLRNRKVDREERQRIVGILFEAAVRNNNRESGIWAPMNQADCAAMIQEAQDFFREIRGLDNLQVGFDDEITGWELTNWATSVMKADRVDMTEVFRKNQQINQFIYNELQAADKRLQSS